jgi:hypothetical protein
MLIYIAIAGMLIGSAASAADERRGLAEPPLCSAVMSQDGKGCRLIDSRGNERDCTTGDTNSSLYVPTMWCRMWRRGGRIMIADKVGDPKMQFREEQPRAVA